MLVPTARITDLQFRGEHSHLLQHETEWRFSPRSQGTRGWGPGPPAWSGGPPATTAHGWECEEQRGPGVPGSCTVGPDAFIPRPLPHPQRRSPPLPGGPCSTGWRALAGKTPGGGQVPRGGGQRRAGGTIIGPPGRAAHRGRGQVPAGGEGWAEAGWAGSSSQDGLVGQPIKDQVEAEGQPLRALQLQPRERQLVLPGLWKFVCGESGRICEMRAPGPRPRLTAQEGWREATVLLALPPGAAWTRMLPPGLTDRTQSTEQQPRGHPHPLSRSLSHLTSI